MSDDDIEVAIELRTIEQRQVSNWLPEVRDRLDNVGRDDRIATLDDLYIDPITEEGYGPTVAWYAFLTELNRLKGPVSTNRIDYFQHKMARRLADRVEDLT